METGAVVRAVVLDVSRLERVVDLSLKPEFFTRFKDSSDIVPHKKVGILFPFSSVYH